MSQSLLVELAVSRGKVKVRRLLPAGCGEVGPEESLGETVGDGDSDGEDDGEVEGD